jgi:hypothetical protein
MIRQAILPVKEWYRSTGLSTSTFWIMLIAGYVFIAAGLRTELYVLGLRDAPPILIGSLKPLPLTAILFGYGAACCIACHGAFRRRIWGFRLAVLLVAPPLFYVWTKSQLPMLADVWLTMVAAKILTDEKRIRLAKPRLSNERLAGNV